MMAFTFFGDGSTPLAEMILPKYSIFFFLDVTLLWVELDTCLLSFFYSLEQIYIMSLFG